MLLRDVARAMSRIVRFGATKPVLAVPDMRELAGADMRELAAAKARASPPSGGCAATHVTSNPLFASAARVMSVSMRAIHWLGWLAVVSACSPEPEDSAGGSSQQTNPLAPGSAPSLPSETTAPPLAGLDEQLDPLVDDALADDASCLAQTQQAERLGLDILLMLDSSGSMAQELPGVVTAGFIAATKWDAVRESLEAFVQAPETSDIGVGLQYFPLQQTVCDEPLGLCANLAGLCTASTPCAGDVPCLPLGTSGCLDSASCDVASYSTPAVAISSGPERAPAIIESLRGVVPEGETPTGPALGGALEHAGQWAIDHPGRQVVAVLATDGFPTVCAPADIDDLARLSAAAAQAERPVKTFVVGVFSDEDLGQDGQARLDELARAGGTERAFVVETGGDVSLEFLEALEAIRSSAVGCTFALQAEAALDFDRVNLKLTTAKGVESQLVNAVDAAGCAREANGWYYVRDAQGKPTQLEVCPATCSMLQQGRGRVDLQIGCATIIR